MIIEIIEYLREHDIRCYDDLEESIISINKDDVEEAYGDIEGCLRGLHEIFAFDAKLVDEDNDYYYYLINWPIKIIFNLTNVFVCV